MSDQLRDLDEHMWAGDREGEFPFFLFLKEIIFYFYFSLVKFLFLALHLRHLEVPRPGIESELQLPAYTTATATWDSRRSVTYTTAHSNVRSLTH